MLLVALGLTVERAGIQELWDDFPWELVPGLERLQDLRTSQYMLARQNLQRFFHTAHHNGFLRLDRSGRRSNSNSITGLLQRMTVVQDGVRVVIDHPEGERRRRGRSAAVQPAIVQSRIGDYFAEVRHLTKPTWG